MTNNQTITPELLDQLLANYEKPEDLTGADGLFKQLKKALIERALGAELSDHLGYEKGDPAGRGSGSGSGNSHNGGDRPGLAPRLGTRRAVLRVRSWRPQDDLHHQRGRGAAPQLAQDHQDPRQL